MREETETIVREDEDGRPVRTERIYIEPERRNGGGFGFGLFLGIVISAIAVVLFAVSQGSFTEAGVEADQATSAAQVELNEAADDAGAALETAGDEIEQRTDNLAN